MAPNAKRPLTAFRTHSFTESVIREMTRVAREHDAINLAQGFPDFPAPEVLKEAAVDAIRNDINQYAITWGASSFREALAARYAEWYRMEVNPETEVTVTCGATEGMASVMLSVVNPGDEVIVPEPFYENYGPDAILSDAKPVYLPMDPPEYRLDLDRLRALVSPRTRAIVLNTPNNPTGRVFSRDELLGVAALARHHGFLVITDEIYEHILYEGQHIPVATLPGMRDLTVTVSGLSKTFSITGWRVGTIVAPPDLTSAIRKVHDFLTVGSPAPLQEACAVGLSELGEEYYWTLAHDYRKRRDIMVQALGGSRFSFQTPEGAYYILADFSALSDLDDVAFAHILTKEAKVATVPGSSFFRPAPEATPSRGSSLLRFAFCKKEKTLEEAGDRLLAFARKIAGD